MMSDTVLLACIVAVPATLTALANFIVTIRNHNQNVKQMAKLTENTNGIVQRLQNSSMAQGVAEGTATGVEQERVRTEKIATAKEPH